MTRRRQGIQIPTLLVMSVPAIARFALPIAVVLLEPIRFIAMAGASMHFAQVLCFQEMIIATHLVRPLWNRSTPRKPDNYHVPRFWETGTQLLTVGLIVLRAKEVHMTFHRKFMMAKGLPQEQAIEEELTRNALHDRVVGLKVSVWGSLVLVGVMIATIVINRH